MARLVRNGGVREDPSSAEGRGHLAALSSGRGRRLDVGTARGRPVARSAVAAFLLPRLVRGPLPRNAGPCRHAAPGPVRGLPQGK